MTRDLLKIWIISQESSTPDTSAGAGTRHLYLAQALASRGHDVTLVVAGWHHLLREDLTEGDLPERQSLHGVKIIRVPVGRYKGGHSKKRILNWLLFAAKLATLRCDSATKPDIVYVSSPPLTSFLGAEFLARRFRARLVFETRDIWPLTLIKLGGFSKGHAFIRFLSWIERRAYRKADVLIGTAPGMVEHMVANGGRRERFLLIRNGIAIDSLDAREALDSTFERLIPEGGFKVGYCGTIGLANAVDVLIEAASLLKDREDIHILIVGQGRAKSDLVERARRRGLANVRFLGVVSKYQVQTFLEGVDVCYIGFRDDDLYRFGMSATKIPEYMYSGAPLLLGYSGAYDPVKEFDAGLTVPAENARALAEAIRTLADMSVVERKRLGQNGRAAALRFYGYHDLALQLEQALLGSNNT